MTNKNYNEHPEITDCLLAFNRSIKTEWALKQCHDIDALASLTIEGRRLEAGIEFKRQVRRSMLARLYDQLDFVKSHYGISMIICTDYVDPKLAALFKNNGIQFLDRAGNAYLNYENIFVYIQGQTKTADIRRRENSGRALQSAGLKLCFELMQNPQLADRPYRELADVAGISLYAVKCVMDDLADKGFVERGGRQRQLCHIERLLGEWCIAYRDRLRLELMRGTYQAKDIDWWQGVDIKSVPACWGGEVAAARLGFMRAPNIHTVYCRGNVNALIAAGKLHRRNEGNVELLDTFWHNPKGDIAPDLIIYADLITSGVERNIETAKELYAQRIKNRFA